MLEVSAASVVHHLDAFGRLVSLPPDLFRGLPWDERALRSNRGRIGWDPSAELLDRLGAAAGDDSTVELAAEQVDDVDLTPTPDGPMNALRAWERGLPDRWRGLRVDVADLGAGRAEVRARILPGFRGCRTLLVAARARLRTLSLSLGLPESVIESDEVGHGHARWRLLLPAMVSGRRGDAPALDLHRLDDAVAWLEDTRSRLEELAWRFDRVAEIGRKVALARDVDEVARLTCGVLTDECGHAAARVSVVPTDDDEPLPRAVRGEPVGPPSGAHDLTRGGRVLGRVETWGPARHPDLVSTLLPWLITRLDTQRELSLWRERASTTARERDALALLVRDRPTWIVGDDGRVEWCNEEGHLELAADPGLAQRLLGHLDPTEFEVGGTGSMPRVVRRRAGTAEIERRAARASERWSLTLAQEKVLAQLVRGLSNADAARALSVRESTVESHLGQIYRRSKTGSRAELLFAFWMSSG